MLGFLDFSMYDLYVFVWFCQGFLTWAFGLEDWVITSDVFDIKLIILSYPQHNKYSWLSLDGHLYKKDASVKQPIQVGNCLSLLPLFDSL